VAKFSNPTSFTAHFGVNPAVLHDAGAMDPLLNVDTKLFIDPLLLHISRAPEVRSNGPTRLRMYFEKLMKLLQASRDRGDAAWREASRLMSFSEVAATCLGYGAASVQGSGFGPEKRSRVLATAKEIVDLGVNDPSIFLLIPLLEENVGPDLISDMTTRIILPDLADFTHRILSREAVPLQPFTIDGLTVDLPNNPFARRPLPVVLVPKDVLARLPIASDWSEVADAAVENASLRQRVNYYVGDIWQSKTRKDKAQLRANVLRSKEAVESLLAAITGGSHRSYDFDSDSLGLRGWRQLLESLAKEAPLQIVKSQQWTADAVFDVVKRIVNQFQFLVEDRGLSRLLWHDGKPHHEDVAQRVFFAVAHVYCAANNLDVTPEADTGSGVVDFKFAAGFSSRVLVEAKLSNNRKLLRVMSANWSNTAKRNKPPEPSIWSSMLGGWLKRIESSWKSGTNRLAADTRHLIWCSLTDLCHRLRASSRRVATSRRRNHRRLPSSGTQATGHEHPLRPIPG
jgi:hypothetical protein